MNKEWSEMNKAVQLNLKKRDTFDTGISLLLDLRKTLFNTLLDIKNNTQPENFSKMPFINASGYHCKTIAYSIWHIFRIEDIVANTIIDNSEQVFYKKDYPKKTNASIITTGNELVKKEIEDFSKELNIDELYNYIKDVKTKTDKMLKKLKYEDLKVKVSPEAKERVIKSKSVSEDEEASWLIDYWCGKDIKGLIQMPISRHWIMHIEAALRIAEKLN